MRGFAPKALIDAHFTPRPIPKSPIDRKILESSLPTVMVPSESGSAFTRSAQITNATTNVGVALRSDFFSEFWVERKRISGISKTTRVSFTITAESSASGPMMEAVAITWPTSCTAAPIHAPEVASLNEKK